MGLRKINTIGIKQANKVMHMADMAYNLKKYLKFAQKRVKSGEGMLALLFCLKKSVYKLEKLFLRNFEIANYRVT